MPSLGTLYELEALSKTQVQEDSLGRQWSFAMAKLSAWVTSEWEQFSEEQFPENHRMG